MVHQLRRVRSSISALQAFADIAILSKRFLKPLRIVVAFDRAGVRSTGLSAFVEERPLPVLNAWRRLSDRNKAAVAASAIAVLLAIAALAKAASTPRMALLYAGLEPSTSGEILASLEALDVRADVRGDAIFVPESRRDAIRMALAREGLPRQSQAGFEILDNLKSFSTSSELFDATYWRAKEGELARTILAEPGVRSARVHLAVPKRSAFSRSQPSPSAVVTVRMAFGRLEPSRAQAIRLIVALAVPDLSPEKVAVLDAAAGVVLAPGDSDQSNASPSAVEEREKALEQDLIELLEARVGQGNARVKVTLSVSDEQVVRQERLVDPERRALASRESTEAAEQGADAGGIVSVASNLPEGDAASTTSATQSRRNESSEATRYEISEVKTETVKLPGALRQVQVAVLINQQKKSNSDGAQSPGQRTEAELEALRKLVAAAIGFDNSRGDVVTIESLPFEDSAEAGAEVTSNFIDSVVMPNIIPFLQLVIPAIVTLILGLFVLRPLLATGAGSAQQGPSDILAAPNAVIPAAPQSAAIQTDHQSAPLEMLQKLALEEKGAATAVLKTWLEHEEPSR